MFRLAEAETDIATQLAFLNQKKAELVMVKGELDSSLKSAPKVDSFKDKCT